MAKSITLQQVYHINVNKKFSTLADLNIPPALHFRCAVEDRDPVYSVGPVPILVFGARLLFLRVWSLISARSHVDDTEPLNWGPELWTSFHLIQITELFSPTGCASWPPVRRNLFVRVTRGPVSGYSGSSSPARARSENWSIQRGMLPPEQWPLSTRTYTNTVPQSAPS